MIESSNVAIQEPDLLEVITLVLNAVNLHHIDPKTITELTSLRDGGLELDSVDLLEIIVAVEQRYGVKVADAETGKKYFRTVGGIVEFVKTNRAN